MLMLIKTDMQLKSVYSIPTNFHSRTQLPLYNKIPGGITPATMRFQGGKGNVQLTKEWLDYVNKINNNNPIMMKYLFHKDSGWQNSATYGRVEEMGFEGNIVDVEIDGNRAYVKTFFISETPPKTVNYNDPRLNIFTIVTRDDKLIGTPKGKGYIILIAREGERLYIPTEYLTPLIPPVTKREVKKIIVYNDFTTKELPIAD